MGGQDPSRPRAVPPEGPPPESPQLRAVDGREAASGDKRSLTDEEKQLLRGVFGEGISYGPVRLVRMAPLIAGINGSRAFVLGNTLNIPSSDYDALERGERAWLLVHECTHIWQYQHHGWGYVAEALWAQGFGDGYDYVKALRAGTPWRKMNPEQQAQLIQDAFWGRYFEAPGARFGTVGKKGVVVLPGELAPEDFADFTPVLVAALEELRKPA